jgi:hypothetical protein
VKATGGDQVVKLEYTAHMLTPIMRQFSIAGTGQVVGLALMGPVGRACRGAVQAAQDVEQSRFPVARSTQQNHKLPGRVRKFTPSKA